MKVRIKTKWLAAFMAVGLLTQAIVPATHVLAVENAQGIRIDVDHSALDSAAEAAKQAGVNVTQDSPVDKGTVTPEELDDKKAEIEADYEQQIRKLQAAKEQADTYTRLKSEYDAEKHEYDEKLEQYLQEKQAYDIKKAEYDAALADLENHKNEDGYLKIPVGQPLVFESEPDAILNLVSGGTLYEKDDYIRRLEEFNYLDNDPAKQANAYYEIRYYLNNAQPFDPPMQLTFLTLNQPLVVRYTNLSNSRMNGTKITAVEYTYTLRNTGLGRNEIPAMLYNDPTVTIRYWPFFKDASIDVEVRMYDEQGQIVDTTGALLDFQSLNREYYPEYEGKKSVERVSYYTGIPLEINGSSVKAHGTDLYADISNSKIADGSRFETFDWDTTDSSVNWYGAIVGQQTEPDIRFNLSADNSRNVWFAFDGRVKARNIPIEPVAPIPPTPPVEPPKPDIQVNYHYHILFVQAQLEKKSFDRNDADVADELVNTGDIVKYVLQTSALPAGHEMIRSLVFDDILPTGYEVNLEETKQASPSYSVQYDEKTRVLSFLAGDALLEHLNADLNKEAAVPAPVIVGRVTQAGTTYENSFDIMVNNEYKLRSTPVYVYTSTEPKKDVFRGNTGTSIDRKDVKAGDILTYKVMYTNTAGKEQKVTIKDKIPAFTTYVANSADQGGTYKDGVITWTADKLAKK